MIRALMYVGTFQLIIQAENAALVSRGALYVNLLVSALLSALALTIISALPGESNAEIRDFVSLLVPTVFLSAVAAWQEAQIIRSKRIYAYYYATIVVEVISGATAIILLLMGYGLHALVAQIYIRSTMIIIAYRVLHRPQFARGNQHRTLTDIFRWCSPQYISAVIGQVTSYAPEFLIGALISPAATGIYRAANRVVSAAGDVCGQPLKIIALSKFGSLVARNEDPSRAYHDVLAVTLLLTSTFLSALAVVSEPLVALIADDAWSGVTGVTAALCIGRFFSVVSAVSSPLLVAQGKQKVLVPLQFIATSSLVLGLIVFAGLGIEWATTVVVFSSIVGASLTVFACLKFGGETSMNAMLDVVYFILPASAASIAAVLSTLTTVESVELVLRLVTQLVIFTLVWIAGAFVLRKRILSVIGVLR